ncbi:HNH endonuclease family protein [Streptomyces sp. NPDC051677]|uniref:HNH endonuclease family protein n=1 Tax=Streptomyces sp. NPDC051677 TaxID=3365669 RepID=UPI0037D202D8
MRLARTGRSAAAALSALAALLTPATAHAASAPAPTLQQHAPGDTVTVPVRDALAALTVQDESRTGYERTKFKHWTDADRDSCNTRAEVLLAEAITAPEIGAGCTLTGGLWYSAYDDQYFDAARKLDVDHLVPLAEAWDSGASAWTAKERELYANDLDDARALIAVSAASNRSKADQDPSTWLPPYAGHWCQYVTDWVADKTRYRLTIDPAEQTALAQRLAVCPDQPITVTLAR